MQRIVNTGWRNVLHSNTHYATFERMECIGTTKERLGGFQNDSKRFDLRSRQVRGLRNDIPTCAVRHKHSPMPGVRANLSVASHCRCSRILGGNAMIMCPGSCHREMVDFTCNYLTWTEPPLIYWCPDCNHIMTDFSTQEEEE